VVSYVQVQGNPPPATTAPPPATTAPPPAAAAPGAAASPAPIEVQPLQ